MKLLVILALCFGFSYSSPKVNSGGIIHSYEKKLDDQRKKLKAIKKHLTQINEFLKGHNKVMNKYILRINSIINSRAECKVYETLYKLQKSNNGDNYLSTRMSKRKFEECKDSIISRTQTLGKIKHLISSLKEKVDELKDLKEIDLASVRQIERYIQELEKDVDLVRDIQYAN